MTDGAYLIWLFVAFTGLSMCVAFALSLVIRSRLHGAALMLPFIVLATFGLVKLDIIILSSEMAASIGGAGVVGGCATIGTFRIMRNASALVRAVVSASCLLVIFTSVIFIGYLGLVL